MYSYMLTGIRKNDEPSRESVDDDEDCFLTNQLDRMFLWVLHVSKNFSLVRELCRMWALLPQTFDLRSSNGQIRI